MEAIADAGQVASLASIAAQPAASALAVRSMAASAGSTIVYAFPSSVIVSAFAMPGMVLVSV